jgi:RHS repeat-associated protein
MIVEQINNTTGTGTYLHHDQAGSTRLLTGSTGTVTGKCTYNAYGTLTCEGTATTPLGYDGQYTSSDTGLVYLRNRVYDPATAQFLSVDPLEKLTRAPYDYAEDNPLNYADPRGLSGESTGEGFSCPPGLCLPFPTNEQTERAIEAAKELGHEIGHAASEIGHGIEGVFNSISGEGESSSENSQAGQSEGEGVCGNPATPPGSKFEWKGKGPEGSNEGSWWDPENDESLYPHLGENSHGPHYDY